MKLEQREADVLIIGGGTAGCYAALTAAAQDPSLRILIAEKAHIKRSGCLAAGVNALNAYISKGHSVEDFVENAAWDASGIVREDLLHTIGQRLNTVTAHLEELGLVILKDENGEYVTRGPRNIKINGENIKVLLADAVNALPNVTVLNHVNITDYLTLQGRVVGAMGFSVNEETAYALRARAVLCATGGAAGLYRPNNPGFSRHKMWYPPFNTGAGYAMGIRAGAEMTTFEMRFVALRCKDTIAPTGTIALGVGGKQVNALGEVYEQNYGVSTQGRVAGTTEENLAGRGPCYLRTEGISPEQENALLKAYLNMAPSQTLKWLESGALPSQQNVEIEGTEPYIVGGHTASGYWVDTGRRTTLQGLYAAGDVAGGAPKKFVTGALAEGELAMQTILSDLPALSFPDVQSLLASEQSILASYLLYRCGKRQLFTTEQLEEAMQKIMDEYAGGLGTAYCYNETRLKMAAEKLRKIETLSTSLSASDMDDLLRIYELTDRLTVCQTLIAHLLARKETRWPGFGKNTDHPDVDGSWEKYVNSRVVDGKIQILYRDLVKGGAPYEHSNSI